MSESSGGFALNADSTAMVSSVTLERLRYCVETMFGDLAYTLSFEMLEREAGRMVMQIRADVAAQSIDPVSYRYPSTWWDAFKERWFPSWALGRWPARHTSGELNAVVIYPQIKLPQEGHNIQIWKTERTQ